MNDARIGRMPWAVAAIAGVVLLAAGAGVMYLLMRPATDAGRRTPGTPTSERPAGGRGPAPPARPAPRLADVEIALTREAVERAGIQVRVVSSRGSTGSVRIPSVVEPNAYRRVVVTPLLTGRITRVSRQLGDRVRRGETLAQIYSPELAEAQTRFLTARAELEAAEQQLRRTEKLVELGAASRQELEQVRSAYMTPATAVEGARAQLALLGMAPAETATLSSAGAINATHDLTAPIDGVVVERQANTGLVVDPSSQLFTIVDLSSVWVVGDLYETDFSRVRVGSAATITTTAYPGVAFRGPVSYIDPQVSPTARTAGVRVEVGNPRGDLLLGMYADMQIEGDTEAPVVAVPADAVQNVGDRHVVYLADPKIPGRFVEREVRIAGASGDDIEVLTGVQPGDLVVAEGSFFLRAERERLRGLAPNGDVQTARVTISERGFEPARLSLRPGIPARITFVRTTDKTCGTEVVFPSLDLRRALPLNHPVDIEFAAPGSGSLEFVCGMNMLRGAVVAQ